MEFTNEEILMRPYLKSGNERGFWVKVPNRGGMDITANWGTVQSSDLILADESITLKIHSSIEKNKVFLQHSFDSIKNVSVQAKSLKALNSILITSAKGGLLGLGVAVGTYIFRDGIEINFFLWMILCGMLISLIFSIGHGTVIFSDLSRVYIEGENEPIEFYGKPKELELILDILAQKGVSIVEHQQED